MTTERLAFEGRVAGIGYYDIYDMTWGEIIEYIEAYNERERRKKRDFGILMYQTVGLFAKTLAPKVTPGAVYEEFPYFSQEELDELPKARLRNYRELMEGYVKAAQVKKSKHEVNTNE